MAANFITIAFIYFFFHHPDSLICTSDDRNAFCTQQINPVCALYSGNDCDSPTGYCLKTISNSCAACSDSSISGYILGECPYMPVQACSQEHTLNSCAVMELQGTVCGITEQVSGLGKTVWSNGCQACSAGDASFYIGGETLGECRAVSTSNICSVQDRNVESCEWSDMPVCGYYRGGDCTEEICRKTMSGYCEACREENVLFYFNGDCADLVPIGENGTAPDFSQSEPEPDFVPEEEQEPQQEEKQKTVVKKGKKVKKGKVVKTQTKKSRSNKD